MDNRRNLKKCMALAVLLVVGSCVYVGAAYGQPWDGNGVEGDPYQIWTAEDMQAIGADANYWDAHFKLMQDIDLGGYTGTEFNIIGIYAEFSYSAAFTGVFDGSGNKIYNFTYRGSSKRYIGIFGWVAGEDAEIRDLVLVDPNVDAGTGDGVGALVGISGTDFGYGGTLRDCYVEGGRVSGYDYVGGLVGSHRGNIYNCNTSTSVFGDTFVGGLVGYSGYTCYIYSCSSTGDVSGDEEVGGLVGKNRGKIFNSYSSAEVSGFIEVGGLMGDCHGFGVVISDCYARGRVSGYDTVGGLLGRAGELIKISNCYASGRVEGRTEVGGFLGYHGYDSNYSSCFWDNEVNPDLNGIGDAIDPNVTSKSTAEMQDANTFIDAGWDFVTPVWKMCNGPDYPKLGWEECPELWIEAEIKIVPGTLNLKSKGKWISCYISLPEGYDVGDIRPSSVFLEGGIEAESLQTSGQVATARFERSEVEGILEVGEIEVTVNGALADGTMFSGTDVIRVIDKGGPQRHKRLVGR
ncbi:MAG: hypothetical protein JSV99_03795 [Planctomycetota bacterium]|nr:MAG: hypothetical protein JSV99_03795 [Planctomycetota bacterium]